MKLIGALALAAIALVGCSNGEGANQAAADPADDSKPLVAFAQANSADPWRQVFDAETKAAAEKHADTLRYETQAAEDDPNKQIGMIETFLLKQPAVLLVSPATEAVKVATDKAFDAGTPVILLDRMVGGDKFTAYVGGDNREIGRAAGQYIVEQLKSRGAPPNGKWTVLMIQGISDATPTIDRREGAMEAFAAEPTIEVIQGEDCKYQRQAAQTYMENFLQSNRPVDVVYAHNDEMAIGAYHAYEQASAKPAAKPMFVGIDACQQEVIEMIKEGKLDATFKYPVPGPKAIELAVEIIKTGNKPREPRFILPTVKVTRENADEYLADNPNLAK